MFTSSRNIRLDLWHWMYCLIWVVEIDKQAQHAVHMPCTQLQLRPGIGQGAGEHWVPRSPVAPLHLTMPAPAHVDAHTLVCTLTSLHWVSTYLSFLPTLFPPSLSPPLFSLSPPYSLLSFLVWSSSFLWISSDLCYSFLTPSLPSLSPFFPPSSWHLLSLWQCLLPQSFLSLQCACVYSGKHTHFIFYIIFYCTFSIFR